MSFTRLSLWTGRIPAKFMRSWRQVLLGRIWEQQIFSLFSFMCKHRKQDLRERRTPTYTFLNIPMIHTYIHFLSIHIIWRMITSCVNHKWGTLSLCSHPDKGLGRGSSHRFAHDSPLSAHFISSSAKGLVLCAKHSQVAWITNEEHHCLSVFTQRRPWLQTCGGWVDEFVKGFWWGLKRFVLTCFNIAHLYYMRYSARMKYQREMKQCYK